MWLHNGIRPWTVIEMCSCCFSSSQNPVSHAWTSRTARLMRNYTSNQHYTGLAYCEISNKHGKIQLFCIDSTFRIIIGNSTTPTPPYLPRSPEFQPPGVYSGDSQVGGQAGSGGYEPSGPAAQVSQLILSQTVSDSTWHVARASLSQNYTATAKACM